MPDYNLGHYIREYMRQCELAGTVNKNRLKLFRYPVHWSALKYVNNYQFPMGMYQGWEISAKFGTTVEITSGKLTGHQLGLKLPLPNLPVWVRQWINDPIEIYLSERQTVETYECELKVGETQLCRNLSATFRCWVELRGKVIFNTWPSSDDVDISEIVPNTVWMVEGNCEFHLGLNDSLRVL